MKRADPPRFPDVRLRVTPSGLGWLVATTLIGALSWYKSINLVLIVVYAMLVLLVLNGFLAWRAVGRVGAVRVPRPAVFPDESVDVSVRVTNGSGHPVTVTVTDRAGGGSAAFFLYRLPAGHSRACAAARTFPNRGRFIGSVAVSSGFPFGLLEWERPGGSPEPILVLPRPGAAEPDGLRQWVLRHAIGAGGARRVLRRVTTDPADVRGARPYRTGDAIRDVHWRTTARRGELMVREYDATPSPNLLLVIEPWLPNAATAADRQRLEAALSLAVTIALTWRRSFESPVTVAVPGYGTATAAAEDELRVALAPLADLAGSETTDPVQGDDFNRHLAHSARVVVSSRHDTPYATALARATGKSFVAVSPGDRLSWYYPHSVKS